MIKLWEMLKYTAVSENYNDIVHDLNSFAYVHGDCELTDIFTSEEESLKYLFADGNPIIVRYDKESDFWEVSRYAVQWVEYDDIGNYIDEGELIY